jgi:hypothetical protein
MSELEDAETIRIAKEVRPDKVPDGKYEVVYLKHSKAPFRGGSLKLYIWFQICTEGPYHGLSIYRAYNYYQPLKAGSDLFKDLERLAGRRIKGSVSLKYFKGRVLSVTTRTVSKDAKQVLKADFEQYSVIDKIIRAETKGEV